MTRTTNNFTFRNYHNDSSYLWFVAAQRLQWGLATTNNNWNDEIILSIPFTSEFYAITTIPFAIGGVITGGIYRDYGGINSILRNGFYGGYGKAGIRFFYIAIGC